MEYAIEILDKPIFILIIIAIVGIIIFGRLIIKNL